MISISMNKSIVGSPPYGLPQFDERIDRSRTWYTTHETPQFPPRVLIFLEYHGCCIQDGLNNEDPLNVRIRIDVESKQSNILRTPLCYEIQTDTMEGSQPLPSIPRQKAWQQRIRIN